MAHRKILRHIFKFHGIFESLKFATRGIIYLFLYHRNMRIIFLLGVTAVLAGFAFQLNAIEVVALSITVALVFMAEIFNTAIEMLMNMLTVRYHIRIKLVKDIAAGVVLVTALNALAIGYILFGRKIHF